MGIFTVIGANMSKTDRNTGQNTSRGFVRRETMIAIAVACLFVGYLAGSLLDNVRVGGGTRNAKLQTPQGAVPQPAASQQQSDVENLRKQADNDPENAQVWSALGNAYFDIAMYGDAIAAYTRSLQITPGNPNILTDRGIMYRRSGDPDKAVESFNQAIAAAPDHQMSRFNKGIVLLYDLRDKAGAIEAWEGLARIAPQFRSPTGELMIDLLKELQSQ